MTQRTVSILTYTLFTVALLWGGFTFIVYLGIPVHQLVYQSQAEVNAIGQVCGTGVTVGTYLCRGMQSLFPFLSAVFLMGSPFFAYTLLSVLVFAGVLIWSGYRTGFFHVTIRFRPAFLIALFCLSVWLMGTTFSLGTLFNLKTPAGEMMVDVTGNRAPPPFRRFIEPTAQVYDSAGQQTLAELQKNYTDLLERGCLTDTHLVTRGDAKVYDMSFLCMQASLFSRVGLQIALILWFLLNLIVLGSFLIVSVIRIRHLQPLHLLCLSLGIGALGWSAILWALSLFGALQPAPVRLLFIGMPALLFPQTWWWLRRSWQGEWEVEFSFKNVGILLGWLLLSYLALNFLNVVRPFPIGWDDLGSYLNRPRLLASYGSFIPSMSQFQWEYLTSLGFVLFGFDSTVGSTFAMQINWSAGFISVLVVYAFARLFLGRGSGMLAAMLYYFLPMTGHFSFADMKIDNASFFISVLVLLAACLALFPDSEDTEDAGTAEPNRHSFIFSERFRLFFLAGILAGFSLAVKPTGILGTFLASAIIAGALLGPVGFAAAVIGSFGVLSGYGPLDSVQLFNKLGVPAILSNGQFFGIAFALMAVFLVIAAVKSPAVVRRFLPVCGIFIVGFIVTVLPWMARNAFDAHTFSISTLLKANDTSTPQVSFLQQPEGVVPQAGAPTRYLPADLKLDPEHPACKSNARTEELDRYWGFGTGISHYLGLPWRQVMNIDAFGYYVTLVPALLLFFLLLLYPSLWDERYEQYHVAGAAILVVFLIHSFLSLFAVGWYLVMIGWLASTSVGLAFLSLVLIAFIFMPFTALLWRPEYRWLGLLFAGTWVFLIQWILVGNGVVWYGIGMFLGFAVVLEALVRLAPDRSSRFVMAFFVTMSILVCLVNRLWQFDTQKNLFEYPLGKISASALRESTIPNYDDIRQSVEDRRATMPDTPYTYRIGTFISYFIPKNREVLPLSDHQMGFFNCINQERDHALTIRRLKALGFNGIIFDTNTQTIEKDPNGSLHQKVQAFTDFANDATTGVQVVINDPGNGIAYILLP
ncbi:MAG: hypothetical protein PHZ00_06755 [Candidatus Peribacteraceae bacterium]|nr:hypothetical protein [Candidatus Peribacteraceae bacterium]